MPKRRRSDATHTRNGLYRIEKKLTFREMQSVVELIGMLKIQFHALFSVRAAENQRNIQMNWSEI